MLPRKNADVTHCDKYGFRPCSIFKTKLSTELKTGQQIYVLKGLLPNKGKNFNFSFFSDVTWIPSIEKLVLGSAVMSHSNPHRRLSTLSVTHPPFLFNSSGYTRCLSRSSVAPLLSFSDNRRSLSCRSADTYLSFFLSFPNFSLLPLDVFLLVC